MLQSEEWREKKNKNKENPLNYVWHVFYSVRSHRT